MTADASRSCLGLATSVGSAIRQIVDAKVLLTVAVPPALPASTWTDPEGSRPFVGALLLGYYNSGGQLIYASRVGTGMRADQLADLLWRLRPLQIDRMPLEVAPPRSTRFGSRLVLSRVHWVRSELVVEVKYLTWTEDGLLRQVVYEGVREDKPARGVGRQRPLP